MIWLSGIDSYRIIQRCLKRKPGKTLNGRPPGTGIAEPLHKGKPLRQVASYVRLSAARAREASNSGIGLNSLAGKRSIMELAGAPDFPIAFAVSSAS